MIEIVIPLHNPLESLPQTMQSLISQTDQKFSLLISDHRSDRDVAVVNAAQKKLTAAGVAVRTITSPENLSNVAHWNWSHHQSTGAWLKPLAAGDTLAPEYVARLRSTIEARPEARCVFTNYMCQREGRSVPAGFGWGGRFRSASELRAQLLGDGSPVGPLASAAFLRNAFLALGGFPPGLLAISRQIFACTLAITFGAVGLDEVLSHPAPEGSRISRFDSFAAGGLLAYQAWTDNAVMPRAMIGRLAWRALAGRSIEPTLA